MGSLKIAALTLLCIVALSDAAKKSNLTLKGTVYLTAPDGFTKPYTETYVHITAQIHGQDPKVTEVKWKDCDQANKTCPYTILYRNVPGKPDQYCKVGIKLRYVTNLGGPINSSTESKLAWTGESVLLKDGSEQDFEYDITPTHPTIRLLHKAHDKAAGKTQPNGSVYMEGTLHLEHTEEMREPKEIVVLVSVSGKSQKHASKPIPWSECSGSNKCEYSVESVPANIREKCTVGVRLIYPNEKDRETWTRKNILEVKADVIKQDLNYNASEHEISLKTTVLDTGSTSASTSSSSTGNKKMVTVSVQGTVEFVNEGAWPFSPNRVLIQLKLDGSGHGSKEVDISWFDECSNKKCTFTIPNVDGSVDQTYNVGINTYTKRKDKYKNLVWSNNSLTLKETDNKIHIKYDISAHAFTLAAGSDTTTSSSSSSSSSSSTSVSGNKKIVNVNVEGTAEFADEGPWPFNPKGVFIQLKLDADIHATADADIDWFGNECNNNKCTFTIPNVTGSVDQSYKIGVNTYTKGKDKTNSLVWSNNSLTLKETDNNIHIKYDITKHTFILTAASDKPSSSSTSSSSSSSTPDKKAEQKAMIKMTVKGYLDINLPPNVPKPDDIILYFELENGVIEHATPMGWPANCTGNKCQYAFKDISALAGQKYIMNASLHYAYFGNNSEETNKRLAWSRVFTAAQGENTVNLEYGDERGVPNLIRTFKKQ